MRLAWLAALALPAVGVAGGPAPVAGISAPASELRSSLVAIPAGTFQMGSPEGSTRMSMSALMGGAGSGVAARSDEFPAHSVTISAFEMCSTELTQRQLAAITGEACVKDCDLPVIGIAWDVAAGHLNALTSAENARGGRQRSLCYEGEGKAMALVPGCTGYRLPTEAEWEYAARAGTSTIWPHGDDPSMLKKHAWYGDNAKNKPHPVGQKKPNPWGLYDMFGNAGEWVADWYGPYDASPSVDPIGPASGEYGVLRGGAFVSPARWSRAAVRARWGRIGTGIRTSGVRCARSAT